MNAYATKSQNAYRASSVMTASHSEHLVMLYDGARRFLHQASVAMAAGDVELTHVKLSRAEDILRHLRNTLDMSQGQLAERLQAIYTFSLDHLRRARFDRDPAKLEQVGEMLGRLRDSWAAIAEPQAAA
jgi:flagellar secretion chaperone FliS